MKNKTAQTPPAKRIGLVFTFDSLVALQEATGMNLLDRKAMDKVEMTPMVMRDLVWCGLLHKQPNLKREEAGRQISFKNIGGIATEIQEALVKAIAG